MAHYGTSDQVIRRTGVEPGDLGLEDDSALATLIDEFLDETADIINRRIGTDYTDDTSAVAGLVGIALDVVAATVAYYVAQRTTPVVRVDDFAVRIPTARFFTPDIIERLKLYGSGGVSSADIDLADVSSAAPDVLYQILWDEEQ